MRLWQSLFVAHAQTGIHGRPSQRCFRMLELPATLPGEFLNRFSIHDAMQRYIQI